MWKVELRVRISKETLGETNTPATSGGPSAPQPTRPIRTRGGGSALGGWVGGGQMDPTRCGWGIKRKKDESKVVRTKLMEISN